MSFEDLATALADHETASQRRYADLKSHIASVGEAAEMRSQHLKHAATPATEGTIMSEQPIIKNIFEPAAAGGMLPYMGGLGGAGAGAGAGLGAGLLGGILGGALLGGNGLFGNRHGGDFVTPTQLANTTSSIIDANQNTAVLQGIGDIKAAVPLAEAQAQLAIAGSTADINKSIALTENLIVSGQALTNKAISDAIATSLASQSATTATRPAP